MAIDECLATIRAAAPGLDDGQVQLILDEVSDIAERLQADKNIADLDSAVADAVAQKVDAEMRAAINEKRNAAMNYKVRLRFIQRLREVPAKDVPVFLESILAGQEGNSLYKSSIERTKKAYEGHSYAIFFDGVERRGLSRGEAITFLRKEQNGQALMKESYDPGSSGNPTAKIIAEAMEETNEHLRKLANKYGADIARIPGYLVKQSHDSLKITKATKDAWVRDILPLLDEGRTFDGPKTDAEKIEYLENVWDTLTTGQKTNDFVKDLSALPLFKGPGNEGKRLSHHRSLHFKDGESAYSYMKTYGRSDVGTSFYGGIDMMTRTISAMQHLGPNPKYMLNEIIGRAKNKLSGDPTIYNRINDEYINRLYENVIGAASIMPAYKADGWLTARAVNWSKNISGSAILGGTTLTSVADIGTAAVRLNELGVDFLEAHGSVLKGFLEGRRTGEKREIADSLGIGMEYLIAGVQSRFLGNDGIDGQGSFLLSSVMRVTGLNWMTDTLKTSAALTLSNFLSKQVAKGFDSLNTTARRELSSYGITADDFKGLAEAMRTTDGKSYIDVDMIKDDGLSLKMKEFFSGFADSAVLTPGARTTSMMRPGVRGQPMTEMMLLFMHLKSYSISYWNEVLSRAWKGEGVRMGYGLHLVASMAVYGYLAGTLKDVVAGKEPRELDGKTFVNAIMTSGGLGFYGDLLIGALGNKERFGEGFLEAVGGPILGSGLRSFKAIGSLVEGDIDAAAYKGMRVAKSMLPGANIFYTRLAMDYMFFWQLQEYMRPGWAQNFENRVSEETGSDFFVSPSEAVTNSYLN